MSRNDDPRSVAPRAVPTGRSALPAGAGPDTSIAQWSLREIQRIVREILNDQPVELYLFGSWARGDVRQASDIDIAVLPTGPLDPAVLATLRSALEESNVPYRVDVVDLRRTSDDFRRRVLEEGIRWSFR